MRTPWDLASKPLTTYAPRIRGWKAICIAVSLLGLAAPGAAMAALHRSAGTYYVLSASRSASGTITAEGRLRSPNPHCLEAARFKPYLLRDGWYHLFDSSVLFFDGETNPYSREAQTNIAESPQPNLKPISPAARSPFLWNAVMSPDAGVKVGRNTDSERTGLVSEATGIVLFGPTTPADNNQPYKVRYKEQGQEVVLTCDPFKGQAKVIVQF
jgi:hypothetical protein